MKERCTGFKIVSKEGQLFVVRKNGEEVKVRFMEPKVNGPVNSTSPKSCLIESINAPAFASYCKRCGKVVFLGTPTLGDEPG